MSVPESMWAWKVERFGEPREVARLVECPVPDLASGQVLVQVEYVGLNLPDLLVCRGQFQTKAPLPFTPGAEFSGTIVCASSGQEHRVGQRVMCSPELSEPHGGLAQLVAIDSSLAWELPGSVGLEQAAALGITYVTAHLGLRRRARLVQGETVLVHGGAGGVGTAAIQIAIADGAEVLATVGSAEKAAFCEGLGATAINYAQTDFVEEVLERTRGRGVDVIVDPVGGSVFDDSRRVVAWEGRHLVIGFAAGMSQVAASSILLRNYSVIGVYRDEYRHRQPELFEAMHREVAEQCASGALAPVIGRILPMTELLEGWDLLEAREVVGKVLVSPAQLNVSGPRREEHGRSDG